jgi:SAM-dependent methyltransferase
VPAFSAVAEAGHELQSPTSPEKIRHLGELMRLGPQSRVLDIACGTGGPAVILAKVFGCRIVGVERSPEFVAVGRARIETAEVEHLVEIVEGDARAYPLEPEAWDAALCLGASFVFDDFEGTLQALAPAVRPGGHVAIGEPFWRAWPLPRHVEDLGYLPLRENVDLVEQAGLSLTALIAASQDDWDRYESLHWSSVEDWLAANPDAPEAEEIRRRHEAGRREYLDAHRDLLGWAILAGRKTRASR